MTPRRITRRQAVAEALAASGAGTGAALLIAGCGASGTTAADRHGSTLRTTYRDPEGSGILAPGPGEQLRPRTELGPRASTTAVLATLAHVTDAHVLDAESPARVTFLDRLGPPFQSTFRPQETLTAQVLAGALRAVAALGPDAVIQGGDLIDNDQANELTLALAALEGGTVQPGSGDPGRYYGVQSPVNADPFYYRPDLDSPVHRGLLQAASLSFRSPGIRPPTYPVLGDHDILVAGEITPTDQTRALALGDRALWDMPPRLTVPPGLARGGATTSASGYSPDGPPSPVLVDRFLAQALNGPTVRVPSDPRRRELNPEEVLAQLGHAGVRSATAGFLDYHVDIGREVRLVVLDLARRAGGSGGLVHAGQPRWLADALVSAGSRWVLVISHQPLETSAGGDRLLRVLDRNPRVIAVLSGHIHRNRIRPRRSPAGGYWLISTSSLIDYPQQTRAIRVLATDRGGVAIQTWMLDHVFGGELGSVSRQLAYLDAQGGRPLNAVGELSDRNVTLYRAPAVA